MLHTFACSLNQWSNGIWAPPWSLRHQAIFDYFRSSKRQERVGSSSQEPGMVYLVYFMCPQWALLGLQRLQAETRAVVPCHVWFCANYAVGFLQLIVDPSQIQSWITLPLVFFHVIGIECVSCKLSGHQLSSARAWCILTARTLVLAFILSLLPSFYPILYETGVL